ncbi:hypothetical protein ARMGADRAFT_1036997 [Armillaria gallica]|uniref:Uncharacterized protein n=1 Tax=Armillaria gallica TaxID=47427 RepID=A0A2H3CN40_ARMGA|nr:hypothetical protein ARMGADRAFT_1036997 [Armillaria gallica]
MNMLTSGVASMTHGIVQWFTSHDIHGVDDLHTTQSLDKSSLRGGFTHDGFVPGDHSQAEIEKFHEIDKLEKLGERLAMRYKMVFPWRIDSVAVFDEAKARAFSKRNKQSEEDLRQLGRLHRLRRQGVEESRRTFHAEWAPVV